MTFATTLSANSPQNNEIITNYENLSPQQLLDSADHYFLKYSNDTALIYYSLSIKALTKKPDLEKQKKIVEALNKVSVIYFYMCDYQMSYEFLIEALRLSEKIRYDSYMSKIYTNMGNIYYYFGKYDIAKRYYSKALDFPQDSTSVVVLLNNLGAVELESGTLDSAAFYLNKSLQISRRHNDFLLSGVWNNIASLEQKRQNYDSASYYFHASLNVAKNENQLDKQAENLSDLGRMFFEINKPDSALFYISLSNSIAKENNFLRILADNYLTISKIEEAKGQTSHSLDYYKKYALLKDSISNVDKFGDVNQLQRLYEVSKTNKLIEIKERTILRQRVIWITTSVGLLLTTGISLFIFFQKRKLNTAYKALFEKNLKIIDLQKKTSEKHHKNIVPNDMQDELLQKITAIMEDVSIICDTNFSINMLATMTGSNYTYVSQVINNGLRKNFRSFLNSYRIHEAQRLFSEPDAAKYTIEAVALRVGFKSRSAFRDAFREITGVSPNFYLKSIKKEKNDENMA